MNKSEATFRKYLSDLGLLPSGAPKPAPVNLTLDQELAEIRARHMLRREYNRIRQAAARRRRSNAITSNVVAEPHD